MIMIVLFVRILYQLTIEWNTQSKKKDVPFVIMKEHKKARIMNT